MQWHRYAGPPRRDPSETHFAAIVSIGILQKPCKPPFIFGPLFVCVDDTVIHCLQYSVAIYPPTCSGFVSREDIYTPIQTIPVEICSGYSDGPRPIAHTSPQFDRLIGEDGKGKKAMGDLVLADLW